MTDDTRDIACAYGAFIAHHSWDWWCHLTLPYPRSKDFALKLSSAWINKLNRKIFGSNYYKRGQGVRWVRAAEPHLSGVYHFHFLVAGCEEIHTDFGVESWERLARDNKRLGHAAVITVYDESFGMGAGKYISKYVTSGDLDFGGPWPQLDLAEISQLNAMR